MDGFNRSLAIVVGINDYRNGITPLKTAVNDASQLAQVLKEEHGYETQLLIEHVTLEKLNKLLREILPKEVGPDDRVLFYFAGHGVALESDEGPAGYLIPQDARSDDRHTFLSMQEVHDALTSLSCRHLLTILDCCFAGAFRWYSTRHLLPLPDIIHRERYERFIRDPAWQVITSAAYNQRALDILVGDVLGARGEEEEHSPFAGALFEALRGAGDIVPPGKGDGVITATELYLYLDLKTGQFQTPSLWPLKKHDKGQYIFLVPGKSPDLPPAPQLAAHNNPWRGLESYDEEHSYLFFGREALIQQLAEKIGGQSLIVVLGSSGIGKSSLVKAGVLPHLRGSNHVNEVLSDQPEKTFFILPTFRPGASPLQILRMTLADHLREIPDLSEFQSDPNCLARIVSTWRRSNNHLRLMLVIDQLEELITLCRESKEREQFLQLLAKSIQAESEHIRVVLVMRSDFEPHFTNLSIGLADLWSDARFIVPPMNQDELRKVIERPASLRVLYFEPDELIDKLINEVVQTPRALPLLSFTLSELYLKYLKSGRDNRALTLEDYNTLGGVVGSLENRANEVYVNLDKLAQGTMRNVMLRMVAVGGGETARRRVPVSELEYLDEAENKRKDKVLDLLVDARLIVKDSEASGEIFVEPAHDALVRGWGKLRDWQQEAKEYLPLQRLVSQAASEWERAEDSRSRRGFLWDDNPRLPQLENALKQKRGDNFNDMWLNRIEVEFVEASSRRKRLNIQRLIVIISLAFIVLTSLLIFAFNQRNLFQSEANQRATAQAIAIAEGNQRATAESNAKERATVALARQLEAQAISFADHRVDRALLLSLEAGRIHPSDEANGNLLNVLETYPKLKLYVHAHQADLDAVAFNLDGSRFASGSLDGTIYLRDSSNAQQLRSLSVGSTSSLAFSPDLQIVAAGHENGTVAVWSVQSRKLIWSFQHGQKEIRYLAFSPDGHILASGSADKTISLWNVETGNPVFQSLQGHDSVVDTLAFSPDGKTLASGDDGANIILWDLSNGQIIQNDMHAHDQWVLSLAFSPDGRTLASGSGDHNIILWDLQNFQPKAKLARHTSWVKSLGFSPDGRVLASGSQDAKIILWDMKTLQPIDQPLEGHTGGVYTLAFSPDNKTLLSGGSDDKVIEWDINAFTRIGTVLTDKDKPTRIFSVALSPDGKTLAAGDRWDGSIDLWDLQSQNLIDILPVGHKEFIRSLAFSPNGKILASGGDDNKIVLWNLESHQLLRQPLEGHTATVMSLAFSPDGRILASGGFDGKIILWSMETYQQIDHLDECCVMSVVFSPDGQFLASVDYNGTVWLWNRKTGTDTRLVRQENHLEYSVAFSPDGQQLAWGGFPGDIYLWDIRRQVPIDETLSAHLSDVLQMAYSPDQKYLASASKDGTVIIWGLANLQPIVQLAAGPEEVNSVVFGRDGKRLAAGSCDHHGYLSVCDRGKIIVWNLDVSKWQGLACQIAGRNLTLREWKDYFENQPYHTTCSQWPAGN